MGVNLDLAKTHKHRNIGDLIVVFTWINDERAMVLIPSSRQKSTWFCICESAAWMYDEPEQLAFKAKLACEQLGMRPVPENWVKLATIINEGLPDLIEMPPAPDPEQYKSSFGKLELRADGKAVAGQDLKLDKQVAEYV